MPLTEKTFLQLNGSTICVTQKSASQTNSNPTLIFIHGLSMDSQVWKQQFDDPRLSEFNLLAIDLPGHGESDWAQNPLEGYTLNQLGNTIRLVIEKLEITSYLLVGVSLGANILLNSIEKQVGCKGIVVISFPLQKPIDALNFSDPEFLFGKVYAEKLDSKTIEKYTHLLLKKDAVVPEVLGEAILKSDPKFRSTLTVQVSLGNYENEQEVILNTEIPVVVVLGADDQIYNTNHLITKPLDGVWKDAIQWISNAGHLPQWDNAESFNQLLVDFSNQETL